MYERCRPVLDVLAGDVFDVGPNGAGTTMKLVVNALLGVGMQALAEALALGQHAGLDKELLLDVLEGTSVLAPGYKYKLQNVRADSYPVVLRLAQERSVPVPVTAVAQQICAIEEAKDQDEDFSAVIRTMPDVLWGRSATDPVAKTDKRHRALRKLSVRVISMRLTDSTSLATA